MITQNRERRTYSGLSTDDKTIIDGNNGDIFEEIDTGKEYIYDNTNNTWHEWETSGGGSSLQKFTEKCVLNFTGNVAANTTITTNASGSNITKSGDSIFLGASAVDFQNSKNIYIFINGIWCENNVDILYVSTYSFRIPTLAFNNQDKIVILK